MSRRKKRMFLPRPIYEALPAAYIACGIAVISSAIPIRSLLMFVSGTILMIAAALVIEMRAAYRSHYAFVRRTPHG